jgi:hypothetical protein
MLLAFAQVVGVKKVHIATFIKKLLDLGLLDKMFVKIWVAD